MKRAVMAAVFVVTIAGAGFAQQTGTSGSGQSVTQPGESFVNDTMAGFLQPIQHAIILAILAAKKLLWILLALDIVFLGINIMVGRADNLGAIVMRLVGLGVIVFIVENFALATAWPTGSYIVGAGDVQWSNTYNGSGSDTFHTASADPWTQAASAQAWNGSGAFAEYPGLAGQFLNMLVGLSAGSTHVNGNLLVNPGSVLSFAQDILIVPEIVSLHTIHPVRSLGQFIVDMFNPAYNWQTSSGPATLDIAIMGFVYRLAVWAIYIILTIQLCLAILEFYLILLFAMILIPFIAFEPMRFIGANAFTAVIGQAVRTAIVVTIIALGVSVMDNVGRQVFGQLVIFHADGSVSPNPAANGTIQIMTLVSLVVGSGLLLYLSLHAPNLATSLLTGTPAFSAPHMMQNVYAGARLAAMPAAAISGVARFGTQAVDAVRDRIQGRGGGGMGGGSVSPAASGASAAAPSGTVAIGGGGGTRPEFAPVAPDVSGMIATATGVARAGGQGSGTKITLPPGGRTSLFLPSERAQTIDTGPLPWERTIEG